MKNMLPNAESSRKRRELDAFFSLHYVVTPHTGNEEDDHILLGKIIPKHPYARVEFRRDTQR